MDRVILHSDCNSFYASVECLKHPELRDRPVAVGGDAEQRHGINLAKNDKAKRFGVQTGEALWQARNKCPGLVILPPVYEDYLKFSALTRQIYEDYTDRVESFGLDEAWLDVTGDDGAAVAEEIRRRVRFELGITVSIGVSFNKVFAKLGSDYRKPDAVTLIPRDRAAEIVWPLPVGSLLYVGPATADKLERHSIRTIGQLATADERLLHRLLGKNGAMLQRFAQGLDATPVAAWDATPQVKSVGNSATLPRDMVDLTDAARVLYVLADSVGRRLREQGLMGRCVSVWMRDCTLFGFRRQVTLDSPTDGTDRLHRTAIELVKANYRWERPMRSIGLGVSDLRNAVNGSQLNFFEDPVRRRKRDALEQVGDRLKERFGNKCLVPATLLADRPLTDFDPKKDHVIHPVGWF